MYKMNGKYGWVCVLSLGLASCATYRTESNIRASASTPTHSQKILILEGVPNVGYKEIGPISVSVKKLTVFNPDPTREQANEVLTEKARAIGADAVIKVSYESGIGFTTWGYIDAKGIGVKLSEATAATSNQHTASAEQISAPPATTSVQNSQNPTVRLRELNAIYQSGVIDKQDFEKKKREILDSM